MFSILKSIQRHWGKLLLFLLICTGAILILFIPPLRSEAKDAWRGALVWAGVREEQIVEGGTVYWCPMHPQIKRKDANDVCPICNMALVPLEGGIVDAPEQLTLTPQQIQQVGVVTEPVVRRELYRQIDTTGQIVSDESREARITSWVRGKSRIEKLYVDFVGANVTEGELMAELYSPGLIIAQKEFLLALKNIKLPTVDLTTSARTKLLDQGMKAEQIEELRNTQKIFERIPIYAPRGGTVFERNVQEGQYVSEGEVLFQISDLDHVWLLADIYEDELSMVHVGQTVRISVRSFPGESFKGQIAFIDPMVQSDSRTVRVRIEIPNEKRRLKPGMYARAQVRAELPESLAISENAVLWSGQRQVALVRQNDKSFQPREIRLGKKWLYTTSPTYRPGGRLEFGAEHIRYHEVLDGVYPGEEVVTSGSFLLSAESQFQSVLTKMLPPEESSLTLEQAIGDESAIKIRELLEIYYNLTTSLANDRLEPVSQRMKQFADVAEQLAERAKRDNIPELERAARKLAFEARKASATPPTDLKEARTHYGRISRGTVQLLAENGGQTLFGNDLFLFECGMADVGYENWLWWSSEKFNPYMGQKMLDCGTELEVLKP